MTQELKILHCVLDEKFVDPMIDLTQQLWTGCIHHYVCFRAKDHDYGFIKKTNLVDRIDSNEFDSLIKNENYQVIILHCFYSVPYKLIAKIPLNVKVIWFAWGYDIYDSCYSHLPLIEKPLYHSHSKDYKKGIKDKSLRTLMAELYYKCFCQKMVEKAFNRIDYFSGVIPEEYDMIKENKNNYFFKAKQLVFNYNNPLYPYKLEKIEDPFVDGFDVQIGNSADCTNNHIDVLYLLSKYKLNDRKIIVSLSYAGTERYKKAVLSEGEKLLGDCFTPLTDYMPLQKYTQIVSSVRYSIFYLERQQAMGNIWLSLWRGCFVFLSETNPVYLHLKKRGYIVFSIQKDLELIAEKARLTRDEIRRNRTLLIEEHSYDAERIKAEAILDELRTALCFN